MSDRQHTHERLSGSREGKVSSDRSFGIVFSVVFSAVGLWPLVSGAQVRWWSLIIAGFFLAAALIFPRSLRPLNRIWTAFGLLLHKVVNPIVMGLLFFLVVTPIGLLMRAFGKRPLDLSFDRSRQSYWIERDPPGPSPDSMKNQF